MTLGVLYVTVRSMNSPSQIVKPDNNSYLAKVIGRVKKITKSPAATYASSGAGAGAVVGTLLLGPLGAAIGGAVGGGIGGYLGARRAERDVREAAGERSI